MSPGDIERALSSLKGWPHVIGCMGGEPTSHPEFEDVCKLYQKYVPREKAGLWTSGGRNFEKHIKIIRETFRVLLYNDHSETGKHQPWMIASEECIPDEKLRNELIDNCWCQKLWSPSINTKGAFFCEIAAVFDLLFCGPGGYDVSSDWWKKTPDEFKDQRDRYCRLCSMAIPFPKVKNNEQGEYVSPGNAQRLIESGSPWADRLCVVDETYSREDIIGMLKTGYAPWEYLGEKGIRDKAGRVAPGFAKERQHACLA